MLDSLHRCLIDRVGGERHRQRVAVRRRIHHRLYGDVGAAAGLVLDHDLLPEPLRKCRAEDSQKEAPITDDHLYVNEIARIPMIDIVHFDPVVGYFGDYHHSQKDNLSLISKETLGAIGNVVLNVIYYED